MYWLRPFQIFDVGSWTKDKDKYEIHFLLISPPAESLPLSSYWDKDEGKDQMKFTSNCWKVVFDFERKTKTRKRQKFTSPLCMASPPSWSSPPSSYWAEQETKTMTKARKMGKYEFHFLLMYGFVPFLIFTFFWFFTFTFFFFFNFAAWTFPCFRIKFNKNVKQYFFPIHLVCVINRWFPFVNVAEVTCEGVHVCVILAFIIQLWSVENKKKNWFLINPRFKFPLREYSEENHWKSC